MGKEVYVETGGSLQEWMYGNEKMWKLNG